MSSTDNEERLAAIPLSPFWVVVCAVLGIFFVGLIFVLVVNSILPLRPASLAFRYFLPGYVADVAARFDPPSSGPATWRWLNTISLAGIVLLHFAGPAMLIRSLRNLSGAPSAPANAESPLVAGFGLAAGIGLTFFAAVGPLINVSQKILRDKQIADQSEYIFEREILMQDMELMATKALAFYHRSPAEGGGGHRWMDSSGNALLTSSDLTLDSVTFQQLLVDPWAKQKSHFVITVIHPDTLIIYGKRGPEAMTFTNAVVLRSCAEGDEPPGLVVRPGSWQRTYG